MAANIFLNFHNGLKMPAFGLGTWEAKEKDETEAALNLALENGYRHIDTAYAYENEKIIGNVLNQWFSSGKLKREDIFLTTKLPIQGVHPDRVELFIKKSLDNLQLDYVDLYLIHFPVGTKYDEATGKSAVDEKFLMQLEPKTDHAAIWKKMEKQVDAGRTKSIGISNYNISQIENLLKSARIKPANLQVELHVFLQQRELVDFCQKNGITVVAYSPLGSPSYNTVCKRFGLKEKTLPDVINNPTLKEIAKKHSKTTAQIALRFLLQRGIAPIPKSVKKNRILENINVFDFVLDDDDIKKISDLEVGENARICDFVFVPNREKHPDFPFPVESSL